jgi:hypothetical protein
VRVSSANWFKAGVARQRVGPTSSGIAPRACMILNKLLHLLLLLLFSLPSTSEALCAHLMLQIQQAVGQEELLKAPLTKGSGNGGIIRQSHHASPEASTVPYAYQLAAQDKGPPLISLHTGVPSP